MAIAEAGGTSGTREQADVTRRQRRKTVWFVVRRVFKSIVTVYLVATVSFFLSRFMPGSPVDAYINELVTKQGMSHEQALNQAVALLAFDPQAPLPQQYVHYLWRLLHGDMGQSIVSPGTDVTHYVFSYLPWTLFSVGVGLLLAFVLGILIGIVSAYRRGGFLDHFFVNIASIIHAVPNYVWAIAIVIVFGPVLEILPITDMRGAISPGVHAEFSMDFFGDVMYHASLPIAVYTLTAVGSWVLLMKSSTTQVLDEDFVTVAKARGLRDSRIRNTYVGRNAILPLFTQFAIALGSVVGGSILVEQVFQYEGVGYFLYDAIQHRDYPVMQGFFLVITISVIFANLVTDLVLGRIDPRIRTEGEG